MSDLYQAVPPAWRPLVENVLEGPVGMGLADFLGQEYASGEVVYPPAPLRFAALEAVSPDAVKVVILGQDPYHQPGQAMGLSFAVPQGVRIPPSLANIYKELASDVGCTPPDHGDLSAWARQGVLLLNTVLSVRAGQPGSHAGQGWEAVTDALLEGVARQGKPKVFMLWGSHAQKKAAGLADSKIRVLRAPHPSPLSAYRGFLGCRHFSQTNAYLRATGQAPIEWQL